MEPLIDITTYSQYKAGTHRVAIWLIETAKKCGVISPFLPPASGSARTSGPKPEQQSNYNLPLLGFTALARAIAASNEAVGSLPKTLALVIRETILLRRKSCEVYLEKTSAAKSRKLQRSNKGHQHVIIVLEEVLALLQSAKPNCAAASLESTISSIDIVGALKLDASARQITPMPTLEPDPTFLDSIFAIHTFLEDMSSIRHFISTLWADYGSMHIDIMTASVTTDTAFTIMRHSCAEIAHLIPEASTWKSMICVLVEAFDDLTSQGENFLEWTCYRPATILDDLCKLLEPDTFLAEKPGYLGDYDPATDRKNLSPEEKYREDAIILSSLFIDILIASRANLEVPAQDELTAGLIQLVKASDITAVPMYIIFAAQTLLDIHHTLREHAFRAFMELQRTGATTANTLERYLQQPCDSPHPNRPAINNETLRKINAYANEWTQSDVIEHAINKTTNAAHTRQPYQLLRHHPVLCGLKSFRLRLLLHDSGIHLCNATGSIMSSIHLYNAISSSTKLDKNWRDMDYIMSVHSARRIFAGSTPVTPADYLRRFLQALGVSNDACYWDSITNEGFKTPRTLKATSPVKDIFRPRYVNCGEARLTTHHLVSMLSVAGNSLRTSPPLMSREKLFMLIEQRRYTIIELLEVVREGMAAEELHLLFDYFGLHERSMSFLQTIQQRLKPTLESFLCTKIVDDAWQLPLVVASLFKAIEVTFLREEVKSRERGGQMLDQASQILDEFLGEEGLGGPGGRSMIAANGLSCGILKAYLERTL